MTTLREEIAIEILKLNPRERDALADFIGLSAYGLIGLICLVFFGFRFYQFFRFVGMI